MFNKDFYLRLHAQGRLGTTYYGSKSLQNRYLISTLLSWQYRPGSYLYLAYNESRLDKGDAFPTRHFIFEDRTLLIKLSYHLTI